MKKTKTKSVCVKWIENECVKWETRPDGGLELNLTKCPIKLKEKIESQISKGFGIRSKLTQTKAK